MITSLLLAGWKILTLLALGFCLAMGVVGYASRKINRRTRQTLLHSRRGLTPLWNTAPSITTTAFDPNAPTHKDARMTYLADAAISVRWSLVTVGATPGKTVKANLAATEPLGVIDDTTDSVDNDLTVPVHVRLFNGTGSTVKVAINSTVTMGDYLVPDTTNPIYGMTDPLQAGGGRGFNRFGRALQSGVAGQAIEIEPMMPTKVASGTFTSAGGVTTEAIAVAGLLATDNVVVSLTTQAGSETLVKGTPAAGQINVKYSANSGVTTQVGWMATRA